MRTWLLFAPLLPSVAAAFPLQFTHQGRLLDSTGVPLEGTHALLVSLYTQPTGGTPLWDDDLTVTVNQGHYSAVLGADPTDPLQASWFVDNPALYVGVSVDGGPELTARTQLVPVPFTVVAQNVSGGTVDASEVRIGGQVVLAPDGTLSASRLASGTTAADVTFTGTVTIDGPLVSKGSLIVSPAATTWTAFAAGYPNTWYDVCGNPDYHPCGLVEAWVRLYTGGASAIPAGSYWTTGSISRDGDSFNTKGLFATWWGSTPSVDCASGNHPVQAVYSGTPQSQYHAPGCRPDSDSYKFLCCYDY